MVNNGAWDAIFHGRSEERSALHHLLVQARWRGSGDSLGAALASEDFQFAYETGSTVRPCVEYSTPVAKRPRMLSSIDPARIALYRHQDKIQDV